MPHMVGPGNQPASSLNEGQAGYILIDPALREAGWTFEDRTQVGLEIPVDGYDAAPWNGVTDYCLYASGGSLRNELPGPLSFSSAEFILSADQPQLGLSDHPRDERVALLDPLFQVLL